MASWSFLDLDGAPDLDDPSNWSTDNRDGQALPGPGDDAFIDTDGGEVFGNLSVASFEGGSLYEGDITATNFVSTAVYGGSVTTEEFFGDVYGGSVTASQFEGGVYNGISITADTGEGFAAGSGSSLSITTESNQSSPIYFAVLNATGTIEDNNENGSPDLIGTLGAEYGASATADTAYSACAYFGGTINVETLIGSFVSLGAGSSLTVSGDADAAIPTGSEENNVPPGMQARGYVEQDASMQVNGTLQLGGYYADGVTVDTGGSLSANTVTLSGIAIPSELNGSDFTVFGSGLTTDSYNFVDYDPAQGGLYGYQTPFQWDPDGMESLLVVTDQGSSANIGSLVIGDNAYGGEVAVAAGATLTVTGTVAIGSGATSIGWLVVDGAGSDVDIGKSLTLDGTSQLTIGDGAELSSGDVGGGSQGSSDAVTGNSKIQNGATFETDSSNQGTDWALDVGSQKTGNGTVTVDGQGSTLTVGGGGASVGDDGQGSLTVSNGAELHITDETYGIVIGTNDGSTGTVDITGQGSKLNSEGPIIVGESGTGKLTVENGSSLKSLYGYMTIGSSPSDAFITVGALAGGSGKLIVTGEGTTAVCNGTLTSGDAGVGTIQILESANFTADGSVIIGAQSSSNGSIIVGDGATFDSGNDLVVGLDGTGSLRADTGATFTYSGDTLVIGEDAGSIGIVTFRDPTTTINYSGELIAGENGSGLLTLDQGVSFTSSDVIFGENQGSKGGAQLGYTSATTWTITGDLTDGESGKGDLELEHGDTVTIAGALTSAQEQGSIGNIELFGPDPGGQNATLSVSGAATIGENGDANFLATRGSAATFLNGLTLAQESGSNAEMILSYGGQANALFQRVTVGGAGSATVEVQQDGLFDALGSDVVLGADEGGYGEIDVNGAYTPAIGQSYPATVSDFKVGTLTVGGDGTGVLAVSHGGTVEISTALNEGANSSVSVESGGSITVNGSLYMDAGASFTASGKDQGTNVKITGDVTTGAKGIFRLDDAGVSVDIGGDAKFVGTQLVNNTNELHVGGNMTLSSAAGDLDMFTATDQGTLVVVDQDVTIGDGGTAQIDVLAGASVSNGGALTVGSQAGAQGTINVSGDGSIWTAGAGDVTVGDAGNGDITVDKGATFDAAANDVTIGAQSGSTSSLTVSDDGSTFDAASLTVGSAGTGVFYLSDGGSLETGDLTLGEESGGIGTVTVADADSSLSIDGDLEVGSAGKGIFVVDGDSTVSGKTTVGSEAGSNGQVTVNDATLELDGDTTIGKAASGAILVQQGGTITAHKVTVGDELGAKGTLTVDGDGTTMTTDDLTVGSSGAGTLKVTDGAQLTSNADSTLGDLVSANVAKATIATQGLWSITGGLTVGGSGIALMMIQSGGNVAATDDVTLGDQKGASGEIDVTGVSADGSTLSGLGFGGSLVIGNGGIGTLKISDGALVAPTSGGKGIIEIAAQQGSTGTVSVDGTGSELEGTSLVVGGTDTVAGGTAGVTISNQGLVQASDIALWSGSHIALAGGQIGTDTLTDHGGKISGYGQFNGAITGDGSITATGGVLSLSGDVSGDSSLVIAAGSELDAAGVGKTNNVAFNASGDHETLGIEDHSTFLATISGFGAGDTIDLADIGYSNGDTASLLAGNVLEIAYSGGDYDLQLDPSQDFAGNIFQLAQDASGTGTDVTDVACYCGGTLILTEHGEVAVETLSIGDRVMTMSGVYRPIKWIGKRSYGGRFILGQKDILPVCFKAGSLDDNVPRRDLWISPHHAMYLEGVLIEARDLVNCVSVVQAERVEKVEYFHIELDSHDVIIAEGSLSESFIDDDSRGMFHNAHEYRETFGDARPAPARYCAPRCGHGYAVEAARMKIEQRAGLRTVIADLRLRGRVDVVQQHVISGWAQNPDHPEAPVCLDFYIDGELIGHTLANRYRADLQRAGLGSGRHSFEFKLARGLDFARCAIEVRRSLDGAALKIAC